MRCMTILCPVLAESSLSVMCEHGAQMEDLELNKFVEHA